MYDIRSKTTRYICSIGRLKFYCIHIDNTVASSHMNYRERVLQLTRARGIARARDFKAAGIPLSYFKQLTIPANWCSSAEASSGY